MAVLLNHATSHAVRRAGQVFGLWYAVLLTASAVVSPSAVASGAFVAWPRTWLHGGIDHQCWMCGLTRSFSAISHGEFDAALAYHPAGPALYLAMATLAVWAIVTTLRDLAAQRRHPSIARA